MRFSASSYYQAHGDCKFCCYRKTEPGSHIYICSVECVESYDNSLTYTFNPNSILALQFYHYYIAREGIVNTPSTVVVSPPLDSRDTILHKVKDYACYKLVLRPRMLGNKDIYEK